MLEAEQPALLCSLSIKAVPRTGVSWTIYIETDRRDEGEGPSERS